MASDHNNTARVLREVEDERRLQRQKWGNAHDDRESQPTNGFPWHLVREMRYRGDLLTYDDPKLRENLVKIAAMAVAAVETIDRKKD